MQGQSSFKHGDSQRLATVPKTKKNNNGCKRRKRRNEKEKEGKKKKEKRSLVPHISTPDPS
jgi:hypothetical protein